MPENPTDQFAPLPGHVVRDAVLDAARRKRSARPYVVPAALVGGLVAPIVAMGTTDPPPAPVPGAGATVTDTTGTTPVATAPATTDTTPTTETTSTTPDETPTTPDTAPTDRADGDPPPTDTTTTPAPAPEPSPTGIPTDPAAAPLLAKVKAAKKNKGRGKTLKLTDHQRRIVRDAQRNSDIKKVQTALGPSSTQSSQAFNDLLAMPGGSEAIPQKAISSFQIPPFLLPIYQAAGAQYGIRWEVLAAINEIETNYGRNLNISSAGAEGWMQFMPATWETWGTDANRDGRKDPFNPVDAIFAAGRYLKAAGANKDLRRAIFAYNHADWYVNDVLKRARRIAAIPPSLTDALGQMAEGYFPIAGKGQTKSTKDGANIKTLKGSAVIAVQDGEIVKSGTSKRLGRYIQIRDGQGTVYTYGNLARVGLERDGKGWARRLPSTSAPVPDFGVETAATDETTTVPLPEQQKIAQWTDMPSKAGDLLTGATSLVPDSSTSVSAPATTTTTKATDSSKDESEPGNVKKAKSGRKIVAGTVLGRAGDVPVRFEIRPSGAGRIDPAPILSGWKLLQNTALFRVKGRAAGNPGQVLLMSKEALQHRVLHDPRITIYEGGRNDIETGIIDRRVLATLAFLAENGLDPTVSCLRSGHSLLTSSGNVSEHVSGNAVDISMINGTPITGHQGKGSITETTIRKLLTLQGGMKPHQIISLMTFPGTDNTFSMADHYNHIHVGFHPTGSVNPGTGKAVPAVLKPDQWDALVARIGSIDNPTVSAKPSAAALKVAKAQLEDAAKARALDAKDAQVDDYDSYQQGIKDPFIPPWLARDQT